jgi:hypothetical protein
MTLTNEASQNQLNIGALMTMEQLWIYIGQIVAIGGGGAAVSYLLFQQYGKAWLESKFSQRLEELRHEQNKEVARLRIEIDSMLNGALKLQEKEFEILPKVWELLDKCYLQLILVTSPFGSYADIDSMDEEQVEELLAMTNFTESQKKSVRQANPKRKKYVDNLIWERINESKDSTTELGNYISLKGILMPFDLKSKLNIISKTLNNTSHGVRSTFLKEIPGSIHDYFHFVHQQKSLIDEIEVLIQKRLASHAKAPAK